MAKPVADNFQRKVAMFSSPIKKKQGSIVVDCHGRRSFGQCVRQAACLPCLMMSSLDCWLTRRQHAKYLSNHPNDRKVRAELDRKICWIKAKDNDLRSKKLSDCWGSCRQG